MFKTENSENAGCWEKIWPTQEYLSKRALLTAISKMGEKSKTPFKLSQIFQA